MRANRQNILCIEQDHETAELIAEELLDRGFDLQVAYDGGLFRNCAVGSRSRVVRYQHAHLIELRCVGTAGRGAALSKYGRRNPHQGRNQGCHRPIDSSLAPVGVRAAGRLQAVPRRQRHLSLHPNGARLTLRRG